MFRFVLLEEVLKQIVSCVALDIIKAYPSKLAFAELFRLGKQAGPEFTGAAIVRLMEY